MRNYSIKPQDVLVLGKLIVNSDKNWRLLDIALEVGLSQSEVTHSLERLKKARLLDPTKKKPLLTACREFLIHGLKYCFPVEQGPECRGIPTSHSAKPLSKKFLASESNNYVWPFDEGSVRGTAVQPLYKSVSFAVQRDERLHEFLALIDAIRIGRAREQNLAIAELEKRILKFT